MSESSTQNQSKYKCYLRFYYRRTALRAISDTILIDMDGNIPANRIMTSRSGKHGERQYVVTPGEYIVYDVQRSNSGNTYIILRVIGVDNECNILTAQEWTLHSGKTITMPIEKLPDNIQRILMKNRDSLPLFDYVYW
jgi:hypothetical protein